MDGCHIYKVNFRVAVTEGQRFYHETKNNSKSIFLFSKMIGMDYENKSTHIMTADCAMLIYN